LGGGRTGGWIAVENAVGMTVEKGKIPGDRAPEFLVVKRPTRRIRTVDDFQINASRHQMPNEGALILDGMSETIG
jgi:hypothetical protein